MTRPIRVVRADYDSMTCKWSLVVDIDHMWTSRALPIAADLPADVRAVLRKWLDEAEPTP